MIPVVIGTLGKVPKGLIQRLEDVEINSAKNDRMPYPTRTERIVNCLFGFYGISTFIGYLMPNPFYTNNQFYFKLFSLT